MTDYTWPLHPAADLFPLLDDADLEDLAEDIRTQGLIDPVWLWDDPERGTVLIDGRNRYRACKIANVAVRTQHYKGTDPIGFAVSQNMKRRHLTVGQKAAIGEEIEPMYAAEAAKRKAQAVARANRQRTVSEQQVPIGADLRQLDESVAAPLPEPRKAERAPRAADHAAKVAGTSTRSVQQFKRVKQHSPELAAKVRAGEIALDRAEQMVKKEEKEKARAAQRDELAAKAAAVMVHMSTPPTAEPETPEQGQWWRLGHHLIYCGDSTDQAFTDRAQGAKLAFADPPYNAGKAAWDAGFKWGHDYLAEVAEIVAVTPGISAISDFFNATDMPYRWSMSAWITNGMTRGALGFGNWIYLALFSHAASLHRNAQDVLRITVDATTTGESNHESRKPARLLVDLIELFTAPGDLVVDPFLGSGTTLFAADKTGRRCIGAEINPQYVGEIIAKYGPEAERL